LITSLRGRDDQPPIQAHVAANDLPKLPRPAGVRMDTLNYLDDDVNYIEFVESEATESKPAVTKILQTY
jgi:hypothetical protein